MTDVNKVLEFLKEPKTRSALEEAFKLSNTSSYNLIKWMINAGLVEMKQFPTTHRTGRRVYYQAK